MGNIKLNNSATANTVFNVTATLCLINNNEVLRKIFAKKHDVVLTNSLMSSDMLTKEMKSDLRLLFDTVIITDNALLSEYNTYYTPKEVKPKLPRRMGKKAVLNKVNEVGKKTELHSALLSLNTIKNDLAKLNRFLIKAEYGEKSVSSSHLRAIIALGKTVEKHTNEIIKNG
jgi:hypothetical protein